MFSEIHDFELEFLLRLACAAVLSISIGIEREMHGRAAGIRTSFLVGLGSAMFMILSLKVSSYGQGITDPGRIAAQIVTGIGFLGAGTIIKSGLCIKGLTTAACMWVLASIGMAAGAGLYCLAFFVTIVTLLSLIFFQLFTRFLPHHSYRTLYIKKQTDSDFTKIIGQIKEVLKIQNLDYEFDFQKDEYAIKINTRDFHTGKTDKIFCDLCSMLISEDGSITEMRWYR